jgi:hypothetical protein
VSNAPEQQMADADEAYLTFGGWAKPMADPPALHERRRYTVDVECTSAGIGTSEKGERHTRKLSIIRVSEVTGVKVPAPDDDENQGALFEENGQPKDDSEIGWVDMPTEETADTEAPAGGSNVVDFRGPTDQAAK